MEAHIQSVEDSLIEGLSFRLPNSANFIQDRRSVSFFPSGGDTYQPRGVKIIKFMLAGTDWLDPSTVRAQFKLQNNSLNTPLRPLNPLPANFFRRLRILCGGQVIEDIDFYNRVYNMIHTLLPQERRMNDYAEGFGMPQTKNSDQDESGVESIDDVNAASTKPPQSIDPGEARVQTINSFLPKAKDFIPVMQRRSHVHQ